MMILRKFGVLALAITGSLAAVIPNEYPSIGSPAHFSRLEKDRLEDRQTCSGPIISNPTHYWLEQQDHTGSSRGYAPFIGEAATYPVWRNVRSYDAVGDGIADDTAAIQKAINALLAGPDPNSAGTRYQNEVNTRPALVYVPGGTYKITGKLDLRLNTILVGDSLNRPVFKASSNFNGDTVVDGVDYVSVQGHGNSPGTVNFFGAIKNIVIDTTSINKETKITHCTGVLLKHPVDKC